MKTLDEIMNTPVLLLTSEEINQLDPKSQIWARNSQAQHTRESLCPKHEPVGVSTMRGWHQRQCKNCGMDMSFDSGD